MKYACWFRPSAVYSPTLSAGDTAYYTVVAASPEDAARAFLAAQGESAGDVEVCWSFTEGGSRITVHIPKEGGVSRTTAGTQQQQEGEMNQTITLTREEAELIEELIFDAKRAASKLQTMYMRLEVEPRCELDHLVEQRDSYLKAQKILREKMRGSGVGEE